MRISARVRVSERDEANVKVGAMYGSVGVERS